MPVQGTSASTVFLPLCVRKLITWGKGDKPYKVNQPQTWAFLVDEHLSAFNLSLPSYEIVRPLAGRPLTSFCSHRPAELRFLWKTEGEAPRPLTTHPAPFTAPSPTSPPHTPPPPPLSSLSRCRARRRGGAGGSGGAGGPLTCPPSPAAAGEPEPMAAADPPGAGDLSQLVSGGDGCFFGGGRRRGVCVWGGPGCGRALARSRSRLGGGSPLRAEGRRAGKRRPGPQLPSGRRPGLLLFLFNSSSPPTPARRKICCISCRRIFKP